MSTLKLGFIGAGNMASAIIGGITGSKLMAPYEIGIYDIEDAKLGKFRNGGFVAFSGIKELVAACDAVLLAVKPQNFSDILPKVGESITSDKLIISIAAGITADMIKKGVGFDCRLVLAMPNTPLLLGSGATALSAVAPATTEDLDFAKNIFESAGIAAEIAPDKMSEIIPVNGSSPAFFYYLAKILTENAEESGIDAHTAMKLVAQTMAGSAKMLIDSGKTPQELIDMVCSPGGATLAGMKALDEGGFAAAVSAASAACVKRAYELSESLTGLIASPGLTAREDEAAEPFQPPQVHSVQSEPEVPEASPYAPLPQQEVRQPLQPQAQHHSGKPWYEESTFYQIYPLGFCGAPEYNDGVTQSRISKVSQWIPHMLDTGVDAVYFCPVFESDKHGYDTRDYSKIDCRLGTNADFAKVCGDLHDKGIKVVLDGVFNHVGRGFWAFEDVRQKKWDSQYKDWFHIDFNRGGNNNDGFWYEGWEGHYELVKLNLDNQSVRDYLFECIRGWVKEFDIDGLRLDVAYMLNERFMRELRVFAKGLKPDFFLLGEAIHGDYNRIVNGEMLDSCTNYECYKGIYSSFNSRNMFEIAHSLNRQFGSEQWTLYKGKYLFNFVDNHDVTRISSILTDENHVMPAYGLMFGMPGIPCVYYGSEWGEKAEKGKTSDAALRPCIESPVENALTRAIADFSHIRKHNPALCHGSYRQVYLTNLQYVFEREYEGKRVLVAINADSAPHVTGTLPTSGKMFDLRTEQYVEFGGKLTLPPDSASFYRCD